MIGAASDDPSPGALFGHSHAALIAAFEQVCFEPKADENALVQAVFERPVLLWAERWPELDAYSRRLDGPARAVALTGIELIRDLAARLESHGSNGWHTGGGPVGRWAGLVLNGEIGEQEAAAAAAAPATVLLLSPDYVRRIAAQAAFHANDGRWQEAIPSARLLTIAAEAYPPGPGCEAIQREAIFGWIETVTAACIAVPDGRLFYDARRRGEHWRSEREAAGDDAGVAAILFKLGVLHLDPYQTGRDSRNLQAEFQWWRQRFVDLHGEAMLQEEGCRLPEPLEALSTAATYLDQAAGRQQGVDRGRALKARSDALAMIDLLGGSTDRTAWRACIEEAVALLPAGRFPSFVATLQSQRAYLDGGTGSGPVVDPEIAQADPVSMFDRLGYAAAFERYRAAVQTRAAAAPEEAIEIVRRIWPCLREQDKRHLLNPLVSAFEAASQATALLARCGEDYDAAAAATADLTARERLAALVALAGRSAATSREGEAIAVARAAVELSHEIDPALSEPLYMIYAGLNVGAGANGARNGRWEGTTARYCEALRIFTAIGALESVANLLWQAREAALEEGENGINTLSVALAALTPQLARADLPKLGEQVHLLWRTLIARSLATGRLNPVLHDLQMQAAKGAAFAVMLHSGSRYDARADETAMDLLSRHAPVADAAGFADAALNDYVLVANEVGLSQAAGRTGAAERLAQRFDSHVVARLTHADGSFEAYLADREWERLLDPADLLLDQYFGSNAQGGLATVFVTRSTDGRRATLGQSDLPVRSLKITAEGRPLEMGFFALNVAELRAALQEDPGPALATDEAIARLTALATIHGGIFPVLAEEQVRGRDHLAIVPHGAYHFCPMHLLPCGEAILADRWTVTYLPHPALLRRRVSEAPAARAGFAALGLSFAAGEHGRSPLDEAAEEARTVAALMDGTVWADREATEARFVESLRMCSMVHVATHGQQNVFGPMLQRLFLAPGPDSDGVFHAYEALGLDLRHMELVTLSACETGLGRFDINDNLRGLSATLLIAGVPTLISTLWPVRDSVSRFFFEGLYAKIAEGEAKLAAFRAAQTGTRAAFPAYRDWGAFVYVGCW